LLARMVEATGERDVRPEGELGGPLLELLDSGNEGVLAHALALSGLWSVRQVEGEVLRYARDKNLGSELRAAAFLSLARMDSKHAMAILEGSSGKENPSSIRTAAIEAMCLTDLPEAAKRATALIGEGALEERELASLLKAFLSRTSGEDRLVEALEPVDLGRGVADRLLQALYLSGHLSGRMSELLGGKGAKSSELLSPDEKTISELVRLASEKGDPARGKLEAVSCLGCHRIGSQGGLVGPDLTSLGTTLSPGRIVEELLWPGRQVKEGYSLIQLTTKSGEILQGYERSAKSGEIAIRQLAEDSFLTFRRDRILSVKKLGSAMPPNLVTGMPRQRLLDLIQYLVQLGKTENNGNDRK